MNRADFEQILKRAQRELDGDNNPVEALLKLGFPEPGIALGICELAVIAMETDNAEMTRRLLQKMWRTLQIQLARMAADGNKNVCEGLPCVAMLFLESYFCEEGDWKTMRNKMRAHIERSGVEHNDPSRAVIAELIIKTIRQSAVGAFEDIKAKERA